ncbi:hypothetical protein, partial [Verrucomicrobium spinosum]|uniref:hypothetical protein n=1 Tax=Verrucomicrobium spinosum TaxID=2736 RepID=UPI00155D8DDC
DGGAGGGTGTDWRRCSAAAMVARGSFMEKGVQGEDCWLVAATMASHVGSGWEVTQQLWNPALCMVAEQA